MVVSNSTRSKYLTFNSDVDSKLALIFTESLAFIKASILLQLFCTVVILKKNQPINPNLSILL